MGHAGGWQAGFAIVRRLMVATAETSQPALEVAGVRAPAEDGAQWAEGRCVGRESRRSWQAQGGCRPSRPVEQSADALGTADV